MSSPNRIRVGDAKGVLLNRLVSLAFGYEPVFNPTIDGKLWKGWYEKNPQTDSLTYRKLNNYCCDAKEILRVIEIYKIELTDNGRRGTEWSWASSCKKDSRRAGLQCGPTISLAVWRSFVSATFGDEVDVPSDTPEQPVRWFKVLNSKHLTMNVNLDGQVLKFLYDKPELGQHVLLRDQVTSSTVAFDYSNIEEVYPTDKESPCPPLTES